jgi:hypothetical protein
MFIREQMIDSIYSLLPEIREEAKFIDIHVWSPVACRWTRWTFIPRRWRV